MTPWTLVIGSALVHFVWQGTVIGVLAAALLWLLRGASARARYAIACCGLVAMIAAPLATIGAQLTPPRPSLTFTSILRTAEDGRRTYSLAIENDGHPVTTRLDSAIVSSDWLQWLVVLWAAGVLVLLLRVVVGCWQVHRLRAASANVPPSRWEDEARYLAARLGITRALRVVDTVDVSTPAVIGWLAPVILLPVAAMANLSPAQVSAILAHELAHIRRHDFLVNLLQTAAETLLFFHPAVWWISTRIRAEREHCCDDIAVAVSGDAVAYAEALTELAAWATTPGMAMAASGGSLLARVRRLLQGEAVTSRLSGRWTLAVVALVLVAFGGLRLAAVALPQDVVRTLAPQDRRLGPKEINTLLGFELFPAKPRQRPTDDPSEARAWGVTVRHPAGEMPLLGFTARSLIRYAYELPGGPVLDGPDWIDRESFSLVAESAGGPTDDMATRQAIREALERQVGLQLRRDVRQLPAYALVTTGGAAPNLRPASTACVDHRVLAGRMRRGEMSRPAHRGAPSPGAQLHTSGPLVVATDGRSRMPVDCGYDDTITGPRAYRVTLAEFARELTGNRFVDRDIVDQTGLSGRYDIELDLGFLPLAAVASHRGAVAHVLRPFGIRTIPEALETQLGLRLEPVEVPYDVTVIAGATRPVSTNGQAARPSPDDASDSVASVDARDDVTSALADIERRTRLADEFQKAQEARQKRIATALTKLALEARALEIARDVEFATADTATFRREMALLQLAHEREVLQDRAATLRASLREP